MASVPGGAGVTAKSPQAESQATIKKVHVGSVVNNVVPLTGEFKGKLFTYDVLTNDSAFAKRLAAEFAKHEGKTLKELGELEIDF